ncbi:MAG: hypothetical protein ACTHKT_12745 [Solirubrobacterales bacterium]
MIRRLLLGGLVCAVLAASGCGAGVNTGTSSAVHAHLRQEMRMHRLAMHRHARMIARRQRARLVARRRHRAEVRQLRTEEAEKAAAEEAAVEEEEASECDPNYSGACLDPYASDYDCEGGSGNGPEYTGTVTVVGEDHYGLDADGDGIGCEAE